MMVALVLLLVAIAVVAFRDRQFLFEAEPAQGKVATQQALVPAAAAPTTAAEPSAVAPSASASDATAVKSIPSDTTVSQPAGSIQQNPIQTKKQAGSNPVSATTKQFTATKRDSAAAVTAQAAQRARVADVTVQEMRPEAALYPRLDQRTKVEGSVELQALVGTDGTIQDLRVMRGPAVLGSAAREAVMQWKFKPYTQNGVAVETYAHITVNFTIRVVDGSQKTVASVEPEHVIILADNYQR
jgi:protein TonB